MTVQIPNEVGTTLAGTPSPASIATESKDGVAQSGLADHIQQVSVVGMMAEIKEYLTILTQIFSSVVTTLNIASNNTEIGALKVSIEDNNTTTTGGAYNSPFQTQITRFINPFSGGAYRAPQTGGGIDGKSVSAWPLAVSGGVGGRGQVDPLVHDLNNITWTDSLQSWASSK